MLSLPSCLVNRRPFKYDVPIHVLVAGLRLILGAEVEPRGLSASPWSKRVKDIDHQPASLTSVRSTDRSKKRRRSKETGDDTTKKSPTRKDRKLTILRLAVQCLQPNLGKSQHREIILTWNQNPIANGSCLLVLRLSFRSGQFPKLGGDGEERWRRCRCPELQGYSLLSCL